MKEKKIKKVFLNVAISADFIAQSIAKHALKKEIGAHSIFLGQVRNDLIEDKKVIAIEYSTYESMAELNFHTIREEIIQKFDLTCMHIYHSLGLVNAGEISLFVFTSSVHRKAAIQACEEIVERIKQSVPVWGKEIFEDETHRWKKNNV